MRHAPAVILGGGPAGSAAAIVLARGGARPLVLERQRETGDALCGGFMSWRSLETLRRLGVMIEGHSIDRLRVFSESHVGEARLPGRAIGVSRHRLDTLLLTQAERAGAAIERGVTASAAGPGRVDLFDGARIECDALLLATGKHDARGLARPRTDADPSLGLRLRIPPSPALVRLIGPAIELHMFRGGYAGLLLQEDGSANLCMAVRKSRLTEHGGPIALLRALGKDSPRLAERLAHADLGAAIDAIGAVPYGWRAREGEAGLFRLGDQAAVIPSLAGEGMSIALASGVMAAEALLEHGPAGATCFQHDLARRTARPVGLAKFIRDAAERGPVRALAPRLVARLPALTRPLAAATRIAPLPA